MALALKTKFLLTSVNIVAEGTLATVEISRIRRHYAVQGHSTSPISVPIEGPYATFY